MVLSQELEKKLAKASEITGKNQELLLNEILMDYLEDIIDVAIAEEREKEPTENWIDVKNELLRNRD